LVESQNTVLNIYGSKRTHITVESRKLITTIVICIHQHVGISGL